MQAISDPATEQHGLITSEQLRAIGADHRATSRAVAEGRLHRLHVGVYAVGHTSLTPTAIRLAAVLTGGNGALTGRWSAGRHLGFVTRPEPKGILEVAVQTSHPRRPGIRLMRLQSLTAEDVWTVDGVPCTSASRTLFDLASVLGLQELERATERAEYKDQLDVATISAIAARIDRPRGIRNLRHILGTERLGAARAGSNLERRYLRLILDAGLLRPQLQRSFVIWQKEQIRVDFFWPQSNLVVEVDGPHHKRPLARRRDAQRDAGLRALGLTVHRVTEDDLDERPLDVIATTAALL